LRIGIFSQCYLPTLNGVVVSIETFRKELEKRGHEFFIFTTGNRNSEDKNPTRVFRYPSIPSTQKDYPIALPYLAPLQTARIRTLGLEIIHSQHIFAMGKLGLKVGRSLNIPVIHTYHTLITEYTHYIPLPSRLVEKVLISLSRNYCNLCDQVVTPSSSMKKILLSYGVKTPIEVIPTGVDPNDFTKPYHSTVLRAKWHIPEGKKILLYVSRIAREKNLDFLFEAVRELRRKRNDFHLLMVGGGPEVAYYQKQVKRWGLENLVTFAGRQPKEDTNRFYGAADIFVFPSITETQGIVLTEAQAAGLPVVAVGLMGPKDFIRDDKDGFLTPLQVGEFSGKIEKLLDNEYLRKRFGRQAQKNAVQFSAENTARKMEKLYERTLSNYSQ